MSEYPEFVFVAYDGDMTTEDYDISVSLEAGSLVGKPVKYIRHDINTRAVPDVPELLRYDLINPDTYRRVMSKIQNGDYVLHSQAAEIIAAKDAEIERLKPYGTELLHLAEAVGEEKDPFAAWETIEPAIERAEAAEAKLAQYEAQEPVGYRYQNCFGGEPFSDQMWQYASFPVTKQGDATDFACEPLYASPAPAADLKADNERLREALKEIHAILEADRTGMFEGLKNIINVSLGETNA